MAFCSPGTKEENCSPSPSAISPEIKTMGGFPARELSTRISAAFADETAANNITVAAQLHIDRRFRSTENLHSDFLTLLHSETLGWSGKAAAFGGHRSESLWRGRPSRLSHAAFGSFNPARAFEISVA